MARTDRKSNLKIPSVSIIIPHHGGFDILNECLLSLKKSTFKDYEIIIVDNASSDDSIKNIKQKFSDINIIHMESNLGYAGGCNEGALIAKGTFLLFLNNDTVHEDDWIQPMVNLISSDENIGSIQPKILNIENKKLFDYAGASGGFLDIFCFPFLRGRVFNDIEADESQYDNKREIFWASGCAFITRKELFLEILFDKKLFAYMEEIDYSWKLLLLGYRNIVEPKSVIYHDGGTLKNRSLFKSYFNHRNSMILFLTNHNTIIMLCLLIPKLLLEIISLLRYVLTINIKGFIAQLLGYIWILTHPFYILKRIININKIKLSPLYSILNKMYKHSIVFKYFILKKKKYSELID